MQTYFPIDAMQEGESVALFCEVQNAYRFPLGAAVTVTRTAEGFRYESGPGGTTFADMTVQPNPGHQGLNAHVRAACGAPYAISSRPRSRVVSDAYRAQRALGEPAASALIKAKMWIERYAAARVALAEAEAELIRQRNVDARRYAPGMISATAAMESARTNERAAARRVQHYGKLHGGPGRKGLILSTEGGPALSFSDGAAHKCGGYDVRWIEGAQTARLRFVGTTDSAWYLDPDCIGESVRGVVYQLPAKRGRVRYLAGYADPWNCDKRGRGPACLITAPIESEPAPGGPVTYRTWTPRGYVSQTVMQSRQEAEESAHDDAKKEAFGTAESIAESMAEAERDYQEAYRAGQDAREKAAEARAEGKAWIAAVRDLRTAWAARLPTVRIRRYAGGDARPVYADLRDLISTARAACESYLAAREAARDAIDESKPGRRAADNLRDAWAQGYREGV